MSSEELVTININNGEDASECLGRLCAKGTVCMCVRGRKTERKAARSPASQRRA